eukprot:166638_1
MYEEVAVEQPLQKQDIPAQNIVIPVQQHHAVPDVIIIQPIQLPKPTKQPIYERQNVSNNDNPSCLYVGACLSIFIPIIGLFMMCCFGCGQTLGPRQRKAFTALVCCIIMGFVFNFLFFKMVVIIYY